MEPAMPSASVSLRADRAAAPRRRRPRPPWRRTRRSDGSPPCARPSARPGSAGRSPRRRRRCRAARRAPPRPLLLGAASTAGTMTAPRMHRPALEGVVEVLAVGGGAVDEGGAGGAERRGVADGGGGAGVGPGAPARLRRSRCARATTHRPMTSISSRSQVSRTAGGSRSPHAARCARPVPRRWTSVQVSAMSIVPQALRRRRSRGCGWRR